MRWAFALVLAFACVMSAPPATGQVPEQCRGLFGRALLQCLQQSRQQQQTPQQQQAPQQQQPQQEQTPQAQPPQPPPISGVFGRPRQSTPSASSAPTPTPAPLPDTRQQASDTASRSYRDDYPYPRAAVDTVDPWSFYYRECTSFVAWRMNRDAGTRSAPYAFHNTMNAGRWSDAGNWDDNARALGYAVNARPARGAIAQWNAAEIGSVGHVAYVERVNSDGTVDISEYNYGGGHTFGYRTGISAPRYIHFDANAAPSTPTTRVSAPGIPSSAAPGSSSAPGQITTGTSVRLSWGGVSGATNYDLGVRDVADNALVVDQRVNGTSQTVNLRPGRQYRWNVAACNDAGCSRFTAPLFFTTPSATATPAPQPRSTSAPGVPANASPGLSSSPGQLVQDTRVRLSWQRVDGATEYDLGVRDMTSNQLVVDDQTASTSYTASLRAGRLYRWNVRACNSAGCSSFTAPLYFRTQ